MGGQNTRPRPTTTPAPYPLPSRGAGQTTPTPNPPAHLLPTTKQNRNTLDRCESIGKALVFGQPCVSKQTQSTYTSSKSPIPSSSDIYPLKNAQSCEKNPQNITRQRINENEHIEAVKNNNNDRKSAGSSLKLSKVESVSVLPESAASFSSGIL